MVGDCDMRGRDERMGAGAYGPYHCDQGVAGMGRSWGGRESWAWRGGAQRGDFRRGHSGRFGGFGRGRAGQYLLPGGAGRGGPLEPTSRRWVWHEDGRQTHVQGKGDEAGEFSEANGGASELEKDTDVEMSLVVEEGRDGGDAGKESGCCSRCSKKGHASAACKVENWELMELGEDEFLTQFPSKAELLRSIAYGGADAKGEGVPDGIRMQFEEWHEKEEGFLLPKVWVRTVDMETTRKNEFGRILVEVLDPKLIPRMIDVVIGDHYFDLEFEVEKREGEGDGEGKSQGPNSDDGLNNDQKKLRNNKRYKGSDGEDNRRDSRSENDVPVNGHVLSKEEFEEFLSWKASKILDEVVEEVLEDLADKVVKESDDSMEGATDNLGLAKVNSEYVDVGGVLMEVEGCAAVP
ncbi:unnamed protein product [Miscanthus lutarioriparius]|uniref:Uncharacterized protein n=1 Tax=Miscanthus lutarioriparius TaxID=422564 RepID=A0A811MT20_9POAL|nr:unnamed protein product [Miscanthus lutarioriparius]